MSQDTDIGGQRAGFPGTRCSVLRETASPDASVRRQAFERLVTAYWKPVYKYLRIHFGADNEDAKDLTQGFFTRAFDKRFFDGYDPSRARFRTYLRVCLDRFVANANKAAARLKRGGGARMHALDFEGAEEELSVRAAGRLDADEFFRREWVRSLFGLAVEDLRRHCETGGKALHYTVFERYDLAREDAAKTRTYADVARQLGLTVTQVTNYLAYARRELRRLVLEKARETTATEDEFQEEVRRLFGGNQR